ncbi:MAG: DNA adenine methylase [Planctomycetota bacterium]
MKTIWYMGVKSRLIEHFIDEALEDAASQGSTLLDMCCGSGALATWAARRHRVVANDVQRYAAAIARAYLTHGPLDLDPDRDLRAAFEENYARLAAPLAEALALEDAWLAAAGFEAAQPDEGFSALGERTTARLPRVALDDYRDFALRRTPRFEEAREARFDGPFAPARELLARGEVHARRADPLRAPYLLATAYYPNVYLGLRQAIATDSLRFAIDRIPGRRAREKREHWLAALLHALSVTTSATSHFCQPRGLTNDGEIRAVLARRSVSIASRTLAYSAAIQETVAATGARFANAVTSRDWRGLFSREGWAGPGEAPAVVYVDPPYTSDNYSRFYHLLEVIADYDYPPLDLRAGAATKGRYPSRDRRHQSAFCRRATVEDEVRDLLEACARSGANVVFSYARESGLLLRRYREDEGLSDGAAVDRFLGLARECFRDVELREKSLHHSGQGDSNRVVTEMLVIARQPRGRTTARARAGARERR